MWWNLRLEANSSLDFISPYGKIPPMTTYELMVVVSASVDLTDEKAQKDLIEKLVGDNGTVTEVTSLGKKTLAYPIKKQNDATYLLATLTGNVKSADIDRKSKLMDEILRFLLTVKE